MNLPDDFNQLMILITIVAIGMAIVGYLTKDSRSFRSRRNRKARKQD